MSVGSCTKYVAKKLTTTYSNTIQYTCKRLYVLQFLHCTFRLISSLRKWLFPKSSSLVFVQLVTFNGGGSEIARVKLMKYALLACA